MVRRKGVSLWTHNDIVSSQMRRPINPWRALVTTILVSTWAFYEYHKLREDKVKDDKARAIERLRMNSDIAPVTREEWEKIQQIHPFHPFDPERTKPGEIVIDFKNRPTRKQWLEQMRLEEEQKKQQNAYPSSSSSSTTTTSSSPSS